MAGRIERGDFAGPMLRILWQSLHAFVDENGRRFDFAQDMPEILEFARTTRWAELTAEATNRPLLLDFEAGGDGGCQEELRLFLEDLLEKTGNQINWVKRRDIYQYIFDQDRKLWSKMEKKPLKEKTPFKNVSGQACLSLYPHPTNPTPPHPLPLFRQVTRSAARLRVWVLRGMMG